MVQRRIAGFVQGVGCGTRSLSGSKCGRCPKSRIVVRGETASDASKAVDLYLPDDTHTEALGAFLALDAQVGDVLLLHGELGCGKTSLARGYIRCFLGYADYSVTSPTYLLDNAYPDEGNSLLEGVTVHHIDLWRLEEDTDVRRVADFHSLYSYCVTLIEWPDRLSNKDLPPNHLDIYIDNLNEGRHVKIEPTGDRWQAHVKNIRRNCTRSSNYPLPVLPPEAVVEN